MGPQNGGRCGQVVARSGLTVLGLTSETELKIDLNRMNTTHIYYSNSLSNQG
jgi:hypothetical protein